MAFSDDDATAIRALTDAHLDAIINHDPAAFLDTCTDDIQFFPADVSAVLGRDACHSYLSDFPTPSAFTAQVQNLEGEGNLAYWQGQTKATFDDGNETNFRAWNCSKTK